MRSPRGDYLFICVLLPGLVVLSGCLALFPASDTATPVLTPTPSGPVTTTTMIKETLAANSCRYIAIATGTHRSLAIRDDGTVVVWGETDSGMMAVPANLKNVTAIAAGQWHNLALTKNGTVVAWGGKSIESLVKDYDQFSVPANLTDITAISAGELHNLALKRDGTIVAWGSNEAGESAHPPCRYEQVMPG